jgi:hypothetical protein
VSTGGDPKDSKANKVPSSLKVMFKVTDSITSSPAPVLQMVILYSTSWKQKCSSTSPFSSSSQTYPTKVKTGTSSPSTIIVPNTSSKTRPESSSQDESITN